MGKFTTEKLEVQKDKQGNYEVNGVKVSVNGKWRSRPRGRRLFSETQIRAIRKDMRTFKEIAGEYGCSHVTIYHIWHRSIYRDVI